MKIFGAESILVKVILILSIISISVFMISCSPVVKDIVEETPQNVVDVVKEDNKENDDQEINEKDEDNLYMVENPLITYMKEDGLYFAYINDGEETIMHPGSEMSNPKISPDGDYIVYTFEDDLYVYNMEVKDYVEIEDEVVSYAFADNHTLVYSAKNKGLTKFDLITGDKIHEVDDNIYENLTYAKENIIYGKKLLEWSDDQGEYVTNVGIVQIDATNLKTELAIAGKKNSEDEIGYDPTIFNISKDGRYIYIMEKFASGSMSADFGSLGLYDTVEKNHTSFEDIYEDKDWSEDDLIVLPQRSNVAINPLEGNMVSIIKGGNREMISDKEVVLLNIKEDKSYEIIRFMDKDLVAKTPNFTLDGKRILYSATAAVDSAKIGAYNNEFEAWFNQPHNIYEYDIASSKVVKVTDQESFDFMPISFGDSILFFRSEGNEHSYFSLIKTTDGKEEILFENIMFKDQYYGDVQTGYSMDILLIKKSNR